MSPTPSCFARAVRCAPGILFILALTAPMAAAQPLFGARVDYPAGGSPYGLAVADLNEDGWPDIVVTNQYATTIAILFGGAGGSYGPPRFIGVGSEAAAVEMGNIDADGHLDLAVTRTGGQAISILIGNGDGTFRSAASYAVGVNPVGVAIADFNRDGRPDLAVVNEGSNACCWRASVLLADSGGFAPQTKLQLGRWPVARGARDLNGDDIPDLVVTNNGAGSITVMPGVGDGTFGPGTNYYAGGYPHHLAMGDLNGDGRTDVVVGGYPEGFNVLLGTGGGAFGAPTHFFGGSTPAVALGDLDGDGRLDLATADWDSDSASVFLGHGDGSFGPRIALAAGTRCVSVAIADLDRDGRPDLVVTNALSNTVSVFLAKPVTAAVGPGSQALSELDGARPDPFATSTQIAYRLARDGQVRLSVYDVRGREVALLEAERGTAGPHAVAWDARGLDGRAVPAGVYFVRLRMPDGGARTVRVVRLP